MYLQIFYEALHTKSDSTEIRFIILHTIETQRYMLHILLNVCDCEYVKILNILLHILLINQCSTDKKHGLIFAAFDRFNYNFNIWDSANNNASRPTHTNNIKKCII